MAERDELTSRLRRAFGVTQRQAEILLVCSEHYPKMASWRDIWEGTNAGCGTSQDALKVHIHRMRKKLGDRVVVESVHGQGLRLASPGAEIVADVLYAGL